MQSKVVFQLLRGTAREVTFRMGARQDDGERIRDTVGAVITCSIGADNYITSYASDDSGIAVDVKGFAGAVNNDPCVVTIRRTAVVPHKKPRSE